jgi:hypothetical protein
MPAHCVPTGRHFSRKWNAASDSPFGAFLSGCDPTAQRKQEQQTGCDLPRAAIIFRAGPRVLKSQDRNTSVVNKTEGRRHTKRGAAPNDFARVALIAAKRQTLRSAQNSIKLELRRRIRVRAGAKASQANHDISLFPR